MTTTLVRLSDGVEWMPFDIPDAIAPAHISQLRREERRGQVLLVRFPPGWARPVAGAYEAAEELVVLDGDLTMSGQTYGPGDWAYFPAGWLRDGSESQGGMLGLARFDGPARWVRGVGDHTGALRARLSPDALDEPVRGALGTGWPLRDTLTEQVWFLSSLAAGAPSPFDVEIFDLAARTWVFIDEGVALPEVTGSVFARAFPSGPGEAAFRGGAGESASRGGAGESASRGGPGADPASPRV